MVERYSTVIKTEMLRKTTKLKMLRNANKSFSKLKNNIVKENKLSVKEKKDVKKYYKQYGINSQTKFHDLYKSVEGTFDVRFISEDVYGSDILPVLNYRKHVIGMTDKNIFDKLFSHLNQPLTLIRKIKGNYYNKENQPINNDEIKNILIAVEKVIIKPASGSNQGKGIGVFNTQSSQEVIQFLSEAGENLIVQKFIQQSKILEKLNPPSVQIFRVMTLRLNNKIHYLGGYLSIGRAKSNIANITNNTISVSIDECGQLESKAIDSDLNVFNGHPDYKYEFPKIPSFNKIIEFSKQLHSEVPWFDIIGWDISIDSNENPIFIEMNASFPGVIYPQFFWGPLFGELTEEVLLKVKKESNKGV